MPHFLKVSHTYVDQKDGNHKCSICENKTAHNMSYTANEDGETHNGACLDCSYTVANEKHTYNQPDNSCVCGATNNKESTKLIELTFNQTVGAKDANVSSYSNSWTATRGSYTWQIENFNNNQKYNNSWTYIKAGNKDNALKATIATNFAITSTITKVVVEIDAITVNSINSIEVIRASDADFTKDIETVSITKGKGTQNAVFETPKANMYYKLVVDCKAAKAVITISSVAYWGY